MNAAFTSTTTDMPVPCDDTASCAPRIAQRVHEARYYLAVLNLQRHARGMLARMWVASTRAAASAERAVIAERARVAAILRDTSPIAAIRTLIASAREYEERARAHADAAQRIFRLDRGVSTVQRSARARTARRLDAAVRVQACARGASARALIGEREGDARACNTTCSSLTDGDVSASPRACAPATATLMLPGEP